MGSFSVGTFSNSDVDVIQDSAGNRYLDATKAVVPSGTLNVTSNGTKDCSQYANVNVQITACTHNLKTLEIDVSSGTSQYEASGNDVWNKVTLRNTTVEGVWMYKTSNSEIAFYATALTASHTLTLYTYSSGWITWNGNASISYDSEYGMYKIVVTPTSSGANVGRCRVDVKSGTTTVLSIQMGQSTSGYTNGKWYKATESGTTYTLTTTVGSAPAAATSAVKSGTFTPTSSDNVSGGGITIETSGYAKYVVVIATDEDASVVDAKAPIAISICSTSINPSASESCIGGLRYKGTTAGELSSYIISGTDTYDASKASQNANSASYLITVNSSGVKFKTYGSYCFRVGKTYRYWIL